jgi:hypothetical protein
MAPRFGLNSSRQTARLRLAYSAPQPDNSTIDELRRLTLPATKALPFVKLRANDQPLWRPESYWNVRSTGEKRSDLKLGRAYAREAIAAMKADRNTALIGLILQDIINNAVARGGRNGSGRLSHLVVGFVDEISQAVSG